MSAADPSFAVEPPSAPQASAGAALLIPVSVGELIDKITILEIKVEHLVAEALAHARQELALLSEIRDQAALRIDPGLLEELRQVNRELWRIEDAIRDQERLGCFDAAFIALARAVYVTNDRRYALKRALDERHGSRIREQKAYRDYGSP